MSILCKKCNFLRTATRSVDGVCIKCLSLEENKSPQTEQAEASSLSGLLYAKFADFKTGCPNNDLCSDDEYYCRSGGKLCCVENCFVVKRLIILGI